MERRKVRLTGKNWREPGTPEGEGDHYYERGQVYEIDYDGSVYGQPLFHRDGTRGSYCWIKPGDTFAAELLPVEVPEPAEPVANPFASPRPVRLTSGELTKVNAMLKKLSKIEPFVNATELGLEGVSLSYEVEETVVGSFSYSYEWDSWYFEPAMTFEETN